MQIAEPAISFCDINGLKHGANALSFGKYWREISPRRCDLKVTDRWHTHFPFEDPNRSDYEQSEPTESRPTAPRRPGQARPTAGWRWPAEAGPTAATARSGRTARWTE